MTQPKPKTRGASHVCSNHLKCDECQKRKREKQKHCAHTRTRTVHGSTDECLDCDVLVSNW